MKITAQTIIQFLKEYPLAVELYKRIKSGIWFNTIKRKIRGRGNVIRRRNALLSSVTFDIQGMDNQIEIGAGSVLRNVKFYLRGNRHRVIIGEKCSFPRGAQIWLEDEGCILKIGNNVIILNAHLAVTEKGSRLSIGDDSAIGDEVVIRTGDSHSIIDAATNKRINYAEDVSIGSHCGIYPRSIILKGVHLGENTMVAVASLVTKGEYEPGVILAGNPAKVVKRGITWSLERIPKPETAGEPNA